MFSYLQPDSKQFTSDFDYKNTFADIKKTEHSTSNAATVDTEENDQNLDDASDITILPITSLNSTSKNDYYAAIFPRIIYNGTGKKLSCFAETPRVNSNVKFGVLRVTIHRNSQNESLQTSESTSLVPYFFYNSTSSIKVEHILMLDVMKILKLSLNDLMQMICGWNITCYTECLDVTTTLGHQKYSGTFLVNSMLLSEFIDYFFKVCFLKITFLRFNLKI